MSRSKKRRERDRKLYLHRKQSQTSAASEPAKLAAQPEINGGRGDEAPALTPVAENKIASLMLHANREVWPITEKHEQLAVGVTARNMGNQDGRVSNGAVRNLIAMKGQMQRQAEIAAQVNVQVNVGMGQEASIEDYARIYAELRTELRADELETRQADGKASQAP